MNEILELQCAELQAEAKLQRHIYETLAPVKRIEMALIHSRALLQTYKSWCADELLLPDILFLLSADISLAGISPLSYALLCNKESRYVTGFKLLTVDEFIASLKYDQPNPNDRPDPSLDYQGWYRYRLNLPCALITPSSSRQGHEISALTASQLWGEIQHQFPQYACMSRPMSAELREKWTLFHKHVEQFKVLQQAEKDKLELEKKERKARRELAAREKQLKPRAPPPSLAPPPPPPPTQPLSSPQPLPLPPIAPTQPPPSAPVAPKPQKTEAKPKQKQKSPTPPTPPLSPIPAPVAPKAHKPEPKQKPKKKAQTPPLPSKPESEFFPYTSSGRPRKTVSRYDPSSSVSSRKKRSRDSPNPPAKRLRKSD